MSSAKTEIIGPTRKLGLLTIGRKRPGFDQQWNEIMRAKADEALAACGFEVTRPQRPVIDDQTTRAAIAAIRAAGCDALLVLQPSLGNGQLALTVSQEWDAPLLLWATPERAESQVVSSCSLVAQHLWASTLRQAGRPFELVYGDPTAQATRDALTTAAAICRAPLLLRHAKVGLIGQHAPGFLNMAADVPLIRRALGTQLHPLSLPQFIDRARAIDEAAVAKDVATVREMKLPLKDVAADDLATNSRYYLALRELADEEQLDAMAVQCWPELPNVMGQWPYLAFARLNGEGKVVALEGDVDGAITCLLAQYLGLGSGFITDWLEHDAKSILFWHPGNASLEWCNPVGSPQGPALAKHFNIQKPMVLEGPLRTDVPVTISRLWRCDDAYHLTAAEGRIVQPRRKLTGNYASVELPDRDVREWFDTLCHAGVPHHVVLFAGSHRDALRRAARAMKVDWLA
jgi:L-fucose isomerase-like protein